MTGDYPKRVAACVMNKIFLELQNIGHQNPTIHENPKGDFYSGS